MNIRPRPRKGEMLRNCTTWRLEWHMPHGFRALETYHGTKTEAKARWQEVDNRNRKAGKGFSPSSQTLSDYLADYLQTATIRPTTRNNYAYSIDKLITPDLGDLPLTEIDAKTLEEWARNLLRTRPDLAPSTVGGAVRLLRAVFAQAYRHRQIAQNPFDFATFPDFPKKGGQFFTEDELTRLLALPDLPPLFAFLLLSGLRIGEAMGLQWGDIKTNKRDGVAWLTLSRQFTTIRGRSVLAPYPKTQAGARVFPLSQPATSALLKQADKQDPDGHKLSPTAWVFATSTGSPPLYANIRREWQKTLKRAGLAYRPLHSARHTFISTGTANGIDPRTMATLVGHADPAFTLRAYSHPDQQALKRAVKELGDIFDDAPPW